MWIAQGVRLPLFGLLCWVAQAALNHSCAASGCPHLFRVRHFGPPWPGVPSPAGSASGNTTTMAAAQASESLVVASFELAGSGLLEIRLGNDVAQRVGDHAREHGLRYGIRKRTEAFAYQHLQQQGRTSRLKVLFASATSATALAQAVLLLAAGSADGAGNLRGARAGGKAAQAAHAPHAVAAFADGFSLCAEAEHALWSLAARAGLTRLVLLSAERSRHGGPLGVAAALNALLLGGLLPDAALLAVLPRGYYTITTSDVATDGHSTSERAQAQDAPPVAAPRDLFVQAEHVLRCYAEPRLVLAARVRDRRARGQGRKTADKGLAPLLLLLTPRAARRVGAFDVGVDGAGEEGACALRDGYGAIEEWLARARSDGRAVHDASLRRFVRAAPCRETDHAGAAAAGPAAAGTGASSGRCTASERDATDGGVDSGVGVVLSLRDDDAAASLGAAEEGEAGGQGYALVMAALAAAIAGRAGTVALRPAALLVLSNNRTLSAAVAAAAAAAATAAAAAATATAATVEEVEAAAAAVVSPWRSLGAAVGSGVTWLHGTWGNADAQRRFGEQLLHTLPGPRPSHVLHAGLAGGEARKLRGAGGWEEGGSGGSSMAPLRFAELPRALRRLYGGFLLPAPPPAAAAAAEQQADDDDVSCVRGMHIERACLTVHLDEFERATGAKVRGASDVSAAMSADSVDADADDANGSLDLPQRLRFRVLTVGDGNVDRLSPGSASVVFGEVATAVCGGLRELGHACDARTCEDLRVCDEHIEGCAGGGDGGRGRRVGLACRLVILGVHNLPNYHAAGGALAAHALLPHGSVLYNFETLNPNGTVSFHYTKAPAPMLRLYAAARSSSEIGGTVAAAVGPRYHVWDYSRDNVEILRSLGVPDVHHVPLGYVDALTHPWSLHAPFRVRNGMGAEGEDEDEDADIDVLFYGSCNGYRARLLARLRSAGLHVMLANPDGDVVAGTALEALVRRAKVVLNLRYYGSGSSSGGGGGGGAKRRAGSDGHSEWKMTRLLPLLANRCFVISELCGHREEQAAFAAGLVFAHDVEDMARQAVHYLARPAARRRIAEAGFEIVRKLRAADMLRPAVRAIKEAPP